MEYQTKKTLLYFFCIMTASAAVVLPVFLRSRPTTPTATTESVATNNAAANDSGCRNTDFDRVQRNIVWRTLNGELLPDSPERSLALGLLPFVHGMNGYALQDATDRIVNRFTAYYDPEHRARMFHQLTNGTPEERVAIIERILAADRAATNLLGCVLADPVRMHHALRKEPVPLE